MLPKSPAALSPRPNGSELVLDFQLGLMAGKIVEIQPARDADRMAGDLRGKDSRDSKVVAQLGIERRSDEHRLAAEMLQGKTLVSAQVPHLRSEEQIGELLKGDGASN